MFYQYDVRPPPSFTHSANLSGMFRKYGRSSASVRAFQTFQMAVRSPSVPNVGNGLVHGGTGASVLTRQLLDCDPVTILVLVINRLLDRF